MMNKNKKDKNSKRIIDTWLTSGVAQFMVMINGIVVTVTAFLVFSYMINTMTVDERKRVSQEAGQALVEGIVELENSMRLVSSLLLLSEKDDKDALAVQIKNNVPDLDNFDQILWLYEEEPMNWQYKIILQTKHNVIPRAQYHMIPDKSLITRMLSENFFGSDKMRIVSSLEGMDYIEERKEPQTMARSFAFVKPVKKDDYSRGVVIGVTRASLLFDQSFVSDNEAVSRFTIRDLETERRIYHMDYNIGADGSSSNDDISSQEYGFYIADSEWQVLMGFSKEKNVIFLEMVPYIILFFGMIITLVGTLFIRSNNRQSQKIFVVNKKLEQKNSELEFEITERERLNNALGVAEKDNRAIIDSVSDIIFETDDLGNVLFLSAAWQKVTGFETERSKGNNIFAMLYPEDQERQKEEFSKLINGQNQGYRNFTRLRISDGTFRAIELAFSMIRQDENKKMRAVGTITDVEERRRAERALAEAEKKYRTIVENAAGGLYQLTPEGIYLSANPAMAMILGYQTPEEMLRVIKNAIGTVYIDDQERKTFTQELIDKEQFFGHEAKVCRKDGTQIWVRENVRVVKDENNHVLYFEGSMEDVTQRKEADIALMEAKIQSDMANRAKTEFIGNMSHELRTPLNAIIGFSDIMKNEIMGPLGQDMYKEYAMDIHTSGVGLLRIINEILDISKLEAGNRDLSESEFDARELLNSCIDLYASRMKDKEITLTDEALQMPVLRGEELAIKQIIGNVYANSIQYTPSGGRVTFFTNFDLNGCFRFSVNDTGIGMSANEIEKALSSFGQVDNALDREGAGVGLGLPLAQAMMTAHGGRIEVLSEKGIGTTVTLIFPAERVVVLDTKNNDANSPGGV